MAACLPARRARSFRSIAFACVRASDRGARCLWAVQHHHKVLRAIHADEKIVGFYGTDDKVKVWHAHEREFKEHE